jgi:hypothetical protein
MRAGNARTSVKPGRREETKSVGYAVRPRRLRRPYRHPIPGGAAGSERTRRSRGAARRYSLREQSGHGAGAAPPGAEQPHSGRRITTSPRPAFVVGRASRRRRHASCSARLCGRARQARPIAVIVPAVGLAPGEARRSGDGPAGPASLIEQNQPTGVTTRCGLRCSAGLRQRLDAVACLCIKSNSSVRGSARIAPACHRNAVLQA